MMKKLLTLMLVLVMAAGANAAIQLSIGGSPAPAEYTMDVCTHVMIDVTSTDNNIAYGAWVGIGNLDRGEWTPPWTIDPKAGNTASAEDQGPMGYPGWWILAAKTSDPDLYPISAGKHFEIDYHCKALGDVTVQLLDFGGVTELDSVIIHQVPEPVSMVLLGLGGLLLRRRR
jgi:hypothetical protein